MPKLYFGSQRHADLPLHYGKVPQWLAERMSQLGGAIVESVILNYGRSEFLSRLSDPFWFQSFGAVLGMDWHSSGITTSVMGALKRSVNPRFHELGIYICGGKGKYSRQTPDELKKLSDRTGLNGDELIRSSRLTAKIDNNAIQDGFQVYMHSFVVSSEGEWSVIQQGMNPVTGMARRYHWHSASMKAFLEEPHTFIYGINQGRIINLTHLESDKSKENILSMCAQPPSYIIPELRKLVMPAHHDVREKDVDLARLGSVLALAHEHEIKDFESLLLLDGVGPRAVQSLALVSEIIHGAPARFEDPARFSFAHGGKDGHPFPVPTKTYDTTIEVLKNSIDLARTGRTEKNTAIKNLMLIAAEIEKSFIPNANFYKVIEQERREAWKHGGRTVFGISQAPGAQQLSLF
jgi:uncharacterized protein